MAELSLVPRRVPGCACWYPYFLNKEARPEHQLHERGWNARPSSLPCRKALPLRSYCLLCRGARWPFRGSRIAPERS
jgi:hypothetical protein